ncbi:MAG: O-antigen polysaccharide polymerase Wzy [Bacteroidales bacterium]
MEIKDTSAQSLLKSNIWILKFIFVCILIFLSNDILTFLYGDVSILVKSTFDLNLLICFCFLLTYFIKNKFNKLLIRAWIIFFYLGIFSIISTSKLDNIFEMDLHDGSIYYFTNILVLTCTLIFFERVKKQRKSIEFNYPFINSERKVTNTIFTYIVLIFPLIFIISSYLSVGFIPLLLGQNFVDYMYEYNYGVLYGFKFICVYSILILIVKIRVTNVNLWSLIYIFLFLLIVSFDGKRFVLLVCLISLIPLIDNINGQFGKPRSSFKQSLYIYGIFIVLFFFYMLINAIREGNISQTPIAYYLEKIPFGGEFRDYIFSFNNFKTGQIPGYNYELSSIASFINSSLLEVFGISKHNIVEMGSAYSWMRFYDLEFGVRTGVICELYFAYGYWGLLGMVFVGFLTSKVTNAIAYPKSYFSLFQNCILYSLIIMLIVGQSDVFFGCLSLMFYAWILFKLFSFEID